MGWAQIVMILLLGANIGMNIIKHGEPKEGKYDAIMAIVASFIEYIILKCGGFF